MGMKLGVYKTLKAGKGPAFGISVVTDGIQNLYIFDVTSMDWLRLFFLIGSVYRTYFRP